MFCATCFLDVCGEPENTVAGTADCQATNEFEAKRLALSLKSSQVPVQRLAKIPTNGTGPRDPISNMTYIKLHTTKWDKDDNMGNVGSCGCLWLNSVGLCWGKVQRPSTSTVSHFINSSHPLLQVAMAQLARFSTRSAKSSTLFLSEKSQHKQKWDAYFLYNSELCSSRDSLSFSDSDILIAPFLKGYG